MFLQVMPKSLKTRSVNHFEEKRCVFLSFFWLYDQGLDYECARCCEIGSKAYKFRLLPFKAVDDCKTDESKKGRVVPGIADYEELKESAHALAVRPVELDVAEWGMQRVKDWLQDLLVLNNGVLRPGGSPLAESNDALLPLKLLNRINYGLAFGLDVWDALVSPCISIWCLQVNEVNGSRCLRSSSRRHV
jgi:hypothetical protein